MSETFFAGESRHLYQAKGEIMMRHKILFIWFVLSVMCLGIAPSNSLAQENNEIEFRISLEKSTFIEGEPIIVSSTVINRSNKVQTVKEPIAIGFVSVFNLEQGEGDKKQKFGHIVGGGMPGWQPAMVTLLPQQISSNTCELSYQIPANLMRGIYSLRAKYHLSDYGKANYETNIMEAEPVPFTIIEASGNEKQAQIALSVALNNAELPRKKEALKKFLSQYPHSVYRVPALDELSSAEYYDRNPAGIIDVYLQLLKEKISTSKRELTTFFAADDLVERGDIVAALDLLKNSNQPKTLSLKRSLEKKLNAVPAQNE